MRPTVIEAVANTSTTVPDGRKFTPIVLAHTARSEGSEFSGSAAWENAVRMRWFLGYKLPDTKVEPGEQPNEAVRYLCKRKANYTGRDFRQLEFRDGMFDVAPPPTLEQTLERDELAKRVVLDGVAKLAARGIVASASSNSQEYLPAVLKKQDLNEGHSKAELKTAMNKLLNTGKLVVDPTAGRYANRTTRPGIVIGNK